MSQNRPFNYFFLHFTKELEVEELVMRGGVNDPFEDMPTTQRVTVNQLEEAIPRPADPFPPFFDFCIEKTDDWRIKRRLSPGLKIFDRNLPTDMLRDIEKDPERLWKLQKTIIVRGRLPDQYEPLPPQMQMYPKEIEIKSRPLIPGLYVITPKEDDVKLTTFIQMLRCLPWLKY